MGNTRRENSKQNNSKIEIAHVRAAVRGFSRSGANVRDIIEILISNSETLILLEFVVDEIENIVDEYKKFS